MASYSVSIINEYLSRLISTDPLLGNVSVVGEVSNLNYHNTGHIYFSITDKDSTLKCFFSKNYNNKLTFELKEGMEITVSGSINVFKKGGYYSLFVRDAQKNVEQGELSLKFEKIKKKLKEEGLFNVEHKKKLPTFPKKIGVVTSLTGAAIEDIKRVITEKNNFVDIYIFPVQVQGIYAANDIANMLEYINNSDEYKNLDTLIVGRGGGSQEDLWPFNEEVVARAIYNSNIPIISAVGHEIDISISDFVADYSCPTPTAAANLVVPDIKETYEKLVNIKDDMLKNIKDRITLNDFIIDSYFSDITNLIQNKIKNYQNKLDLFRNSLIDNNPAKILNKGFAIIRNKDNQIVKTIEELENDTEYTLELKDGKVKFHLSEISR